MRIYIISNVRRNASVIFPVNVPPGVYAVGFNHSEVPDIVTLLGNPNKPTEAHPRHPSLLYKDGVIAGGNIFGGVAILNVSQLRFLMSAASECFNRYSRLCSLGQHQSLAPLGSVQAPNPLLVAWSSSQSPLAVLQWPQLL